MTKGTPKMDWGVVCVIGAELLLLCPVKDQATLDRAQIEALAGKAGADCRALDGLVLSAWGLVLLA
jgi:hypothetical protein